jgi:hypothetical protein
MLALCLAAACAPALAADIHVRFKVLEPPGEKFCVTVGGYRHDGKDDQWYLPREKVEAAGGQWSRWLDLTPWPLHDRVNRSGGVAEWPSMTLTVAPLDAKGKPSPAEAATGCRLEVQLADRPDEGAVVISFSEKSESSTIGFLLPHPLRAKKEEFETGSQMTARHRAWADAATGDRPIALKRFALCTSLWGPYDPGLARQEVETLKRLGFNVIGGAPAAVLRDAGVKTYGHTGLYGADPDRVTEQWKKYADGPLAKALATEDGKWQYANMHHFVISDEISVVNSKSVEAERLNAWFREYLRARGVTEADLGRPLDAVQYPREALARPALARFAVEQLPPDAAASAGRPPEGRAQTASAGPPPWTRAPRPALSDLPTRRLLYHASKFGHWWSARQLRQTSDLVRATLPGMKTETLPTDHGFFNAWGPPAMGMSYRLLDLFELGGQETVDYLAAEDWMGLNHMYGPATTWTGAQTFEYLHAMLRCSIHGRPMTLMSLLTPSDDGYLRLKAYSALGQGAKVFFFWTFGPTYIGTENYWSDLRSEYDGLAKFSRALARGEDLLAEAVPLRDPVAVLYCVSHDLWHTDDPASFVENRLTWHALRHLSVQPDFLREEDVEAGRLKGYRVLYVTGQCLTRKASAAIDAWVREGGVVYLAAGAATRDEFYEPYVPPFAAAVWPADAADRMVKESHTYNERVDLPGIKPLATVTAGRPPEGAGPSAGGAELPAIGYRLDLRPDVAAADRLAVFDDGAAAGARVAHGRGRVIAFGFLPGLAYSPFKKGQTTLDEVWPAGPRDLLRLPLEAAGVGPVAQADAPVVETSLLAGPRGSALVLVNYTYRPIQRLRVEVQLPHAVGKAVSTEGAAVSVQKTERGVAVELPVEWTDVVLLPRP